MKNTVWVGGCQSWYLDADGDPAMWPYTWQQWEKDGWIMPASFAR